MSTEAIAQPKPLNAMPAHARLWIYKAPRDLSTAEQKLVRERGQVFTSSWAAHGAPLDACVEVLHARFVLIAVDEEQAMASGCSIDKSVGFVKDLEHDLNLMLTDRMIAVFEHEGHVRSCRLQELGELFKQGIVTNDTIVFDDLVATVGDLRERFRVPLQASWLARFV